MPRKAKVTTKKTYRPITIGKRTYKTCSNAVRYYLKNTSSFSQAEIAQRCHVSEACVSQLATQQRMECNA